MRYSRRLTRLLMLSACVSGASACSTKERVQPIYPPFADLRVEPKPVAGPEIVTSAQAAAEFDVKIESWGERGWRTVARICRWAKENGASVNCPSSGD